MSIANDILEYWTEYTGTVLTEGERDEALMYLEEDSDCGFMNAATNGIPIGEKVLHIVPDNFFFVIPNSRDETAEAIKEWIGIENAIPFDSYGEHKLHYLGW